MPPRRPRTNPDETLFRALLDAIHDAILVHDPETGAILDANQRAAELYGHSREALLEKDVGHLSVGLSPCTKEDALAWMARALSEGPQSFEWMAQDQRGRFFWTEVMYRQADLRGRTLILASVHNITDRKRNEAEQAASLRRAEAQSAVFLALAGVGGDVEAALGIVVHHLAAQVGDLCVLDLLENGSLRTAALDQPYLDGAPLLPAPAALHGPPAEGTATARILAVGEALRESDPLGNRIRDLLREELHPWTRRYHAHSLLAVPMRAEGRALGTITLVKGGASRAYSPEDQAMLQNLADRVALALENARLFGENLRQAEQLRLANADLEARVAARTAELAEANARLHELAITDGLTALANRRRFNDVLDEELRRARRTAGVLSLILCDVDHFKRYNDHYGHAAGDDCLRTVGATLRDVFRRAGELPARYGGEEFAVVLPGVPAEDAVKAAERFRRAMEQCALPHAASEAAPVVTLSLGVVSSPVGPDTTADTLITRADEALYHSKRTGRNRVTLAE